ncbi:MAG: hypothetical protein Q7U57_02675 [Methylovulum sp.]|nr:hypothetical protein [Methylovulum sp.]
MNLFIFLLTETTPPAIPLRYIVAARSHIKIRPLFHEFRQFMRLKNLPQEKVFCMTKLSG